MASHNGISHQFENEPELAERGSNAGAHFSRITENVGEASSAITMHTLWMNSPGHRANLLDPAVDSMGIAIANRDGQLYAVEDFARTTTSLTLDQQEQQIALLLAQAGMQVVDAGTDDAKAARATCAMSSGYAGAKRPWFVMRYTSASLNDIPAELKTHIRSGKYHLAAVGACAGSGTGPFTAYSIAVLLFP